MSTSPDTIMTDVGSFEFADCGQPINLQLPDSTDPTVNARFACDYIRYQIRCNPNLTEGVHAAMQETYDAFEQHDRSPEEFVDWLLGKEGAMPRPIEILFTGNGIKDFRTVAEAHLWINHEV